jgi:hypothetical protein
MSEVSELGVGEPSQFVECGSVVLAGPVEKLVQPCDIGTGVFQIGTPERRNKARYRRSSSSILSSG